MPYMPCTNPECNNSRKTPEQLCIKCQQAQAKKAKADKKAAKPVDK
jgi:hypothetical protein